MDRKQFNLEKGVHYHVMSNLHYDAHLRALKEIYYKKKDKFRRNRNYSFNRKSKSLMENRQTRLIDHSRTKSKHKQKKLNEANLKLVKRLNWVFNQKNPLNRINLLNQKIKRKQEFDLRNSIARRRKFYTKIKKENEVISKRINSTRKTLYFDKLEKEFQRNRQISRKLQRFSTNEKGQTTLNKRLVLTNGRYRLKGSKFMNLSVKSSSRSLRSRGSKKSLRKRERSNRSIKRSRSRSSRKYSLTSLKSNRPRSKKKMKLRAKLLPKERVFNAGTVGSMRSNHKVKTSRTRLRSTSISKEYSGRFNISNSFKNKVLRNIKRGKGRSKQPIRRYKGNDNARMSRNSRESRLLTPGSKSNKRDFKLEKLKKLNKFTSMSSKKKLSYFRKGLDCNRTAHFGRKASKSSSRRSGKRSSRLSIRSKQSKLASKDSILSQKVDK